ncbi:hypothetical protein ABIA39_000349 [Nocardia sp. GAS34]
MNSAAWFPRDGDVHLRIWIDGVVFDYRATVVAARNLLHDWARKRWYSIELIRDAVDDVGSLRRLPCERLYQGP